MNVVDLNTKPLLTYHPAGATLRSSLLCNNRALQKSQNKSGIPLISAILDLAPDLVGQKRQQSHGSDDGEDEDDEAVGDAVRVDL